MWHASTVFFASLLALQSAQTPVLPQPGLLAETVACQSDQSQTYALYLPSRYRPDRRWPALLVFDPGGRGPLAARRFQEPAESYGWVVLASNNTRSGGTMEPNVKAVAAMWSELQSRYSIDPARVYAAGFSAGAMLAWLVGKQPGVLAGVIASGGRMIAEYFANQIDYASFGAAGIHDFNLPSMRKVDELLAKKGAAHRLEIFEGAHEWLPPELARAAIEWHELQAIRRGLRSDDGELVARLFADDLARARELEAAGRPLLVKRRLEAIASTFEGLADVAPMAAEAARLQRSPAVTAALAEEEKWQEFEASYIRQLDDALTRLHRAELPPPPARLAREVRLKELEERATRGGEEGATAKRMLETIWGHLSLISVPQLLGSGEYARAAIALTVAVELRPHNSTLWYNLACTQARTGSKAKALDALARAVAEGFADLALLERDQDLDALRGRAEFKALLTRLATQPPAQPR
ncbi:MAG: PHB depolymerase family esterase [Acidobacteriota bacterium]